MRIYVAAPWVHRDQARSLAALLKHHGHTITHEWWDIEGEFDDASKMQACAIADLEGVYNADQVVLLDSAKSEGKAVEQGIAIACGIPILAIGTLGQHSQNVFHHLPDYQWVDSISAALEVLKG